MDGLRRLFGFTDPEVVRRHQEVNALLEREIKATSICARMVTTEVDVDVREVLETVPPERPSNLVESIDTED